MNLISDEEMDKQLRLFCGRSMSEIPADSLNDYDFSFSFSTPEGALRPVMIEIKWWVALSRKKKKICIIFCKGGKDCQNRRTTLARFQLVVFTKTNER